MEQHRHEFPNGPDVTGPEAGGDALARVAMRLILEHRRQDGSVATQGLARRLAPAAEACNVQTSVLLRAVASQLPAKAARRLVGAFPPANLAPRAPWQRKNCVYRMLDALPPVRWSRYRLGRSRYAWVRQRAADRLGVIAFTTVERAADAAVARFAQVVHLHCFAHLFAHDAPFREYTLQLVHSHATPELANPSGAEQRLNMIALSDLNAWHLAADKTQAAIDYQLGAELVMLSIPARVFDAVTAQIRGLMDQHDAESGNDMLTFSTQAI